MSGRPALQGVPVRIQDHEDAIRDVIVDHVDEMAVPIADIEGGGAKINLKGGPFNGRSIKCKGSPPAIAVFEENKVHWYVATAIELHISAKPGAMYVLEATSELGSPREQTTGVNHDR